MCIRDRDRIIATHRFYRFTVTMGIAVQNAGKNFAALSLAAEAAYIARIVKKIQQNRKKIKMSWLVRRYDKSCS